MWTFLNSELLNTPRAFYNAIIWDIVCNKKKIHVDDVFLAGYCNLTSVSKKILGTFFILLQEHRLYS